MGSVGLSQSFSDGASSAPAEVWRAAPAQPLQLLSAFEAVHATVAGRANVSPRRLVAPGPTAQQLDDLLSLAAAAPDHGHLLPWRFVLVPQEQRHRLGDAFVNALLARDPGATPEQLESAAEKAHRAPLLLLAVACAADASSGIPEGEQLVSLGAAIQNVLLGATAMGFGSGLTSGQAMHSAHLRALFGLAANESAVCFVNIGTVTEHKASKRLRPVASDLLTTLGA
ncbi:nitroreductase [Rhodoferax lacus]|uniref:Nitroreductase n=1 Tax=Rhodoferax lacus TaxID=2184758 RepID=A0A3E1RDM8_9BURK|nr:nitroreductase family protein [Rhodoferax lacus]RFO96710.1 nitroreductase [Rhodoferax lacus]